MTKKIARPKTIQVLIAVPLDVRYWLEQQAARNLMPMTGLIVAAVRRQMDDAERRAIRWRSTDDTAPPLHIPRDHHAGGAGEAYGMA